MSGDTVRTKNGDREILGGEGNGNAGNDWLGEEGERAPLASEPAEHVRAHPVTGEVTFKDHKGRSWKLRPTFEAVLEIEDGLRTAVDGLRTRFAMAGLNPSVTPTTREYGVILAAGLRAAGESRVTPDKATRFAYECGRERLRPALLEYLWALCDGGRGRAEDLGKKGDSSTGLLAADEMAARELIEELERRSVDTSVSP